MFWVIDQKYMNETRSVKKSVVCGMFIFQPIWNVFFLLMFLMKFNLLCPPNEVSYYSYYITPTVVGWCIAILRFFFTIIKFPNLLFLHRFLLLLLLLLLLFLFLFFFSLWACPNQFSETDDPIFTKLHRKVDTHLKRCTQVL